MSINADKCSVNGDAFLHIVILIISALITVLLLLFLFGPGRHSGRNSHSSGATGSRRPEDGKTGTGKPCPLCGERLAAGEKVHSVLYPGKPDSLMEIYGCPHCEPADSKNDRICPVCRKKMTAGSVLIARVFDKPGKKHVHVLGCSECYSGRTTVFKK